MSKIDGLDLFSGYGGISIALCKWVRPIAYCENDKYAQGILLSRMSEGKLPKAPIWDDIKTFPSENFAGKTDIVYGGFPCQDISLAGHGKGLDGEQSSLFFELCSVVEKIKPAFIFLENVPAIRTRGLLQVILQLTNLGYDCRWTSVSAASVGAPHLRKRWFLLAHSIHHSMCRRHRSSQKEIFAGGTSPIDASRWETEPRMGRVANGSANRVDRIKALGNGVVPAQAQIAFKRLLGLTV